MVTDHIIFTELFRWVAWHPIERGFPPLLFQISFILLYQYVKDLKCKIQILFENYNINIELNFNISNFCKKNFKKFLHQFVGSPGLEPRTQGPKSCVLPLHHDPIYKNPVLFFYNVHLSANPCSTCSGSLYPDFQIPMEIINPSYIVPLYLYKLSLHNIHYASTFNLLTICGFFFLLSSIFQRTKNQIIFVIK